MHIDMYTWEGKRERASLVSGLPSIWLVIGTGVLEVAW